MDQERSKKERNAPVSRREWQLKYFPLNTKSNKKRSRPDNITVVIGTGLFSKMTFRELKQVRLPYSLPARFGIKQKTDGCTAIGFLQDYFFRTFIKTLLNPFISFPEQIKKRSARLDDYKSSVDLYKSNHENKRSSRALNS